MRASSKVLNQLSRNILKRFHAQLASDAVSRGPTRSVRISQSRRLLLEAAGGEFAIVATIRCTGAGGG